MIKFQFSGVTVRVKGWRQDAPPKVEGLTVSRIDPAAETRIYIEHVLATAGRNLDAEGRALLEEDLRSPCTEEIAVFHAFSRMISQAHKGFVVLDTAPTGHTLLLDAAGAYHRQVLRDMKSYGGDHPLDAVARP